MKNFRSMSFLTDIDIIAIQSFTSACSRGKTSLKMTHEEVCNSIEEEFKEFRDATDEPSEHIPPFTQKQEELADIIIAASTELLKLCVKNENMPSQVINAKIKFNWKREK